MKIRSLILAVLLLAPATAAAQSSGGAPTCERVPDHVLLARMCVSERGWLTETHDCAAIYEVARWRMEQRGETLRQSLCSLSRRLNHGRIESRRWLLDLDDDAHRPRGMVVPWERPRCAVEEYPCLVEDMLPSRREAWETTLAETRVLVTGSSAPVCSAPPHAWGSDADLRRRRREGYTWVEYDCGPTENHFGYLVEPR